MTIDKTFGSPSNPNMKIAIIPIMNFQASQLRLPENKSVCVVVCVGWLLFLQQCNTERRERESNRASLSSVLISRLDGSHSSLDVLVAHVD